MKPRLSLPGLPLQQVVPYVSLRNLCEKYPLTPLELLDL